MGPLGGGSCCTGRGVVWAWADDASLERVGGVGDEPGGTMVTPGVELVAGAFTGGGRLDDAPGLVSRVADDEDCDGRDDALLDDEDELESLFRFESFGGDRPQSVLPLVAAFGES